MERASPWLIYGVSCYFIHRRTSQPGNRLYTPRPNHPRLQPQQPHLTYFNPLGLAALANPLPLVPLNPPLAAPPLPAGAPPPPPLTPIFDGAGVENFGVAFEDIGGFSTKDVSVVLGGVSLIYYIIDSQGGRMQDGQM
jgi:hypothetical protein